MYHELRKPGTSVSGWIEVIQPCHIDGLYVATANGYQTSAPNPKFA
jgi:hypothetical protein